MNLDSMYEELTRLREEVQELQAENDGLNRKLKEAREHAARLAVSVLDPILRR